SMLEDPTAFRNEFLDVLSLGTQTRMLEELSNITGKTEEFTPEEMSRYEAIAEEMAKAEQLEYQEQLNAIFDDEANLNSLSEEDFVKLFYEIENEQSNEEIGDRPEDSIDSQRDGEIPTGSIETPRSDTQGKEGKQPTNDKIKGLE
ncbi:hypothetical protein PIE20_24640, partial [Escherichia coli]|uniref:hypothetical protein n=1 Tax=Escherichia coli TaxID=562 RepID=UPI0022FDF673